MFEWTTKTRFCSYKCFLQYFKKNKKWQSNSGSFNKKMFINKKNHPRWKGGISKQAWYHTIYSRNYKIRKRKAKGQFLPNQWQELKKQFNFACVKCKIKEPFIKLEADHIIPLALGGTNFITNIQPLCRSCNGQKYLSIVDYRI